MGRLTGNDKETQAKVHDARCRQADTELRDIDIREAYNAAGFPRRFEGADAPGWLFVRYHRMHLNCEHFQAAFAEILSNQHVPTANLTFRLPFFGEYQRLAMEYDGENKYKA